MAKVLTLFRITGEPETESDFDIDLIDTGDEFELYVDTCLLKFLQFSDAIEMARWILKQTKDGKSE